MSKIVRQELRNEEKDKYKKETRKRT